MFWHKKKTESYVMAILEYYVITSTKARDKEVCSHLSSNLIVAW